MPIVGPEPATQPHPTTQPVAHGGGPMPVAPQVAPTAPVPVVTIPAVEAVEAVTMSPFVRGALIGGIAGAAVVGALWWFGGRK